MKKLCGICLMVLALSMFSGCATEFPETDTIYIQKNGVVKEATVREFDKTYYAEDELKTFIEGVLEDYQSDNGSGVEMEDVLVEDGIAKLMMKYDSYQSYKDFDGRELFTGTVVQAIANGYSFFGEFLEVKDGRTATGGTGAEGTEVSGSPAETIDGNIVVTQEDCKVVILNENTDVVVKGTIQYVSAGSVTVKNKSTASVKKSDDGLSYIVYK